MRLLPRLVVPWDKVQRIIRNKEIWDDPHSIVHRLPRHYQLRYWNNLLSDPTPVHWCPSTSGMRHDKLRNVRLDAENYPILPIFPPEANLGLWGGEGIVKGYREGNPKLRKKILPRRWLPTWWWPVLKKVVLYSEILNEHLIIMVTERTLNLVDDAGGLDFYILQTPEYDLCSKLGCLLKRKMLTRLTQPDFYESQPETRQLLLKKFEKFITPADKVSEIEWIGLDLNEACRKLQDLEDAKPLAPPLKFALEKELLNKLITDSLSDPASHKLRSSQDDKPSLLGRLLSRK